FFDLGGAGANFCLSGKDVFLILPAAGVGAVRGGEEGERSANALGAHVAQRVGKERMPVAVAEIDRQFRALFAEEVLQGGLQGAVLGVEGADAAKMLIMLGDGQQTLARNIAPAKDVFQEGNDLVGTFRSTEGNDQHGVVIWRWCSWHEGAVFFVAFN